MKKLTIAFFVSISLSIFSQGPWIVGDDRFEQQILAKDYKFNNIENFKEIIPIDELASSQFDPFQKFITDRYSQALGKRYRIEFLQTTFVDKTYEINRVFILVVDRYAFTPGNFDQSLDYGAFITDLRNIEESYQNNTLISDIDAIFPVLKEDALIKKGKS